MKAFCHGCLSRHIQSFKTGLHAPVSLSPTESVLSTITPADLVLLELIYRTPEGSTEIYEAMVAGSEKHYVAKVQYCRDAAELNARQEEAALQRSIRHPNISRCLASFIDPTHIQGFKHVLVMEHGGKGSLHDLIRRRSRDASPFPEDQLCENIVNLLDAFTYLQSINIVHRDIKPQNIIVMENGSLKVIDFGLSLEGTDLLKTQDYPVMGTVVYLCPRLKKAYLEMWDGHNISGTVMHNPFKSDVYSLGLTLFHMASLRPPSDLNTLTEGEDALQRVVWTAVNELNYGDWVKMTLRKMLIVKEEARPDFVQLKEMVFSDGMYSYTFEDDPALDASVIEPEVEAAPVDAGVRSERWEGSVETRLKQKLRSNRGAIALAIQALVQKALSPEPQSLLIIQYPVTIPDIEVLCMCLDHLHKLDKVEFINAKLTDQHLAVVAGYRFSELTIDEFSLGSNELNPISAAHLSDFLPKCKSLRVLRMWENHLGPEGMRRLCPGLRQLSVLQELFLGSNNLGDDGVKLLAQCFQSLSQLSILSLVHNEITDVGIDYLAEQLRYAEDIGKLFLDSNDIGPAGASYLCAVIPDLKKLTVLRLLGSRLGEDVIPNFKKANPRLRVTVK